MGQQWKLKSQQLLCVCHVHMAAVSTDQTTLEEQNTANFAFL